MGEQATNTPSSINDLTVGMELRGTVKNIIAGGAFVNIGVGKDGWLHISQLGKPNVRNVEDVVKVDETITVYVLRVEKENGRIALSLVQPPAMSWDELRQGMTVKGKVIRMENFGVFVDVGAERPGMIHVSELASGYVQSPSDVVKVGDEVTAQVIKLDKRKKRIDLSIKALEEPVNLKAAQQDNDEPETYTPTAMEMALRRAMDSNGDPMPARARKDDKRGKRNRRDEDIDDIIERTIRGHRG